MAMISLSVPAARQFIGEIFQKCIGGRPQIIASISDMISIWGSLPHILISLPLGFAPSLIPGGRARKLFVGCIGLVYLIAGIGVSVDIGCLITPSLVTYLVLSKAPGPSMAIWVSLVFGHLFICNFRRTQPANHVEALGIRDQSLMVYIFKGALNLVFGRASANRLVGLAHMKLVMKLSGLLWYSKDNRQLERKSMQQQLPRSQEKASLFLGPQPLDYVSYLLLFPTLFSGAHFDYDEFARWVHSDTKHQTRAMHVSRWKLIPRKIIYASFWFMIFSFLRPIYPATRLIATDFKSLSFWSKNYVVCMVAFTFRLWKYGVWTLTEACSMAAMLGFNAESPAAQSWDGAKLIDPILVEKSTSMFVVWQNWNIATQRWLRNDIYLRLPSDINTVLKVFITFLVCGAWHGVMPKWFLWAVAAAASTVPFRYLHRVIRPLLFSTPINQGNSRRKLIYDILGWVITQLSGAFVIVPRVTPTIKEGRAIWSGLHYWLFLLVGIISTLAFALPRASVTVSKVLPWFLARHVFWRRSSQSPTQLSNTQVV